MKLLNRLPGKIGLWLALVLVCLCVSAQTARADVGPKPTMDFEFESEDGLTITRGVLQECADSTCTEAWKMEEYGPQEFRCKSTSCSSMAYGYDREYYRLVITFSDGVTRESNPFDKSHYNAKYRVSVRQDDLLVEETGGGLDPLLLIFGAIAAGIVGLIVCGAPLVLALVIITIALIIKGGQDKASFESSRVLFVAAWLCMLPFFVAWSLLSLAVPLTAIAESLVVLAYATLQKRPRFTLLTLVMLANVISLPVLWLFLLLGAGSSNVAQLLVGECLVWWLEAGLLYLWQRKTFSFKQSLGLSLLLNLVSVIIGLPLSL